MFDKHDIHFRIISLFPFWNEYYMKGLRCAQTLDHGARSIMKLIAHSVCQYTDLSSHLLRFGEHVACCVTHGVVVVLQCTSI